MGRRALRSVGPNARLIADDLAGAIRALKTARDGEIEVAGPALAHSLTEHGLLDEYRIYLHLVVLGHGTPYFAGPRPPLRLMTHDRIGEEVGSPAMLVTVAPESGWRMATHGSPHTLQTDSSRARETREWPTYVTWVLARDALATNNRISMPAHLRDHAAAGGQHWGIFWLRPGVSLGARLAKLGLIWEASDAEERRDRTRWIPLYGACGRCGPCVHGCRSRALQLNPRHAIRTQQQRQFPGMRQVVVEEPPDHLYDRGLLLGDSVGG
jgi:ferredoxin